MLRLLHWMLTSDVHFLQVMITFLVYSSNVYLPGLQFVHDSSKLAVKGWSESIDN